MRVVENLKDVKDQFERATSEAINSFGNGEIFIERFVDHPRHIEVQVLGDKSGNMVHLFERLVSTVFVVSQNNGFQPIEF